MVWDKRTLYAHDRLVSRTFEEMVGSWWTCCMQSREKSSKRTNLHIALGWAKEVKPGRREPDANHLKEPSSPITTSAAYSNHPLMPWGDSRPDIGHVYLAPSGEPPKILEHERIGKVTTSPSLHASGR
jgi:hypothetical protein